MIFLFESKDLIENQSIVREQQMSNVNHRKASRSHGEVW
jgi:hypothetical protein